MKKDKIVIGSRGSKLATIYAEKVKSALEKEFSNKIEIKKIITSGDEKIPDYSYALLISDNATVSSPSGKNFVIQDSIDFSVSSSNDPTTVSIAQITANEPEYFLLKNNFKSFFKI